MTRYLIISFLLSTFISAQAQDATEIVRKADAKLKGEKSSYSEMTMKIIRPSWDRTISFKNWTKGTTQSLALVTAPAKEKGQSFLRLDREMWSYTPSINRIIKMPPSMLSQGWMGSDFTNDDLLNESSIIVDYSHNIVGSEAVDGRECYKIELIPHEDAPVVWGKIYLWIDKTEYLQMKAEYYDEDEYLIKTEIASDVKNMSGRIIPCKFEIIPEDEPGNRTVVTMDKIEFNIPIDDNFFSQQNMKRLR